jgi:2-methylcitrate dehydratase PrpD
MVQPYIDCAIALRRRGVPLDGIERITCATAEGIVHRLWEPLELKRRPPTAYAAKFSTPYGVALALARGHADLGDFADDGIADPELLRLAGLVGFEIDPANPYPDRYTGHVRITYADGRVEEAAQDHMRGGTADPLTRDEIDAKFRANVRFGGHEGADRLLGVCDAIGEMRGDWRLLAELGG